VPPAGFAKPGKPQIDWDDPDAKRQLVSDLVNDALAVLAELSGPDAPEREDKAADALGLLALVAGQDVEPAEDSDGTDGRWRIVRRVAPDRVISVVDTETRPTRKSKANRKDGFRGHIAAEPGTGDQDRRPESELAGAACWAGLRPAGAARRLDRQP